MSDVIAVFLEALKKLELVQEKDLLHGLGPLKSLTRADFIRLFSNMVVGEREPRTGYHPLVVSGCSETTTSYLGLNEQEAPELGWGHYVGTRLDLPYINLSIGGAGIYAIVDRYIAHCMQHGSPNIAIFLMPNMTTRFLALNDSDIATSRREPWNLIPNISLWNTDLPKISKRPHALEDVLPPSTAILYAVRSIQVLEAFCKASGTRLLYTTWDYATEQIILGAKAQLESWGIESIFKNYIQSYPHAWDSVSESCIQHEDIRLSNPKVFDMGSDLEHMGAHRHAHFADLFLENLTNI